MMKRLALLAALLHSIFTFSQDLIVRSTGDSLKCHITQVTDSAIYFDIDQNGTRNTHLNRADIKQFTEGYYKTISNNKKENAAAIRQQKDSTWSTDRNISLELLGSCYLWSVHFENRIKRNRNLRYNVGFSFWKYKSETTDYGTSLFITSGLHYLAGKNRSKFESGIDFILFMHYSDLGTHYKPSDNYFAALFSNLHLGYRYEARRHIFKIGITTFVRLYEFDPLFGNTNITNNLFIMPWPSIGYGFKI